MNQLTQYLGTVFLIVCQSAFSQQLEWALAFGGTGTDAGNSLVVDNDGNVFTAGAFMGTADFDPGPNDYSLTSTGSQDIFIHKVDSQGNFLWALSLGSNEFDYATDIDVDEFGNVYILGQFSNNMDFDPGPGNFTMNTNGLTYSFLLKLNAMGNFVWARSFGGSDDVYLRSMDLDSFGNIFIVGDFSGTADFDSGPGTLNLTSIGYSDCCIQKMDSDGNLIWAKSFGGAYADGLNAVMADSDGNVYSTGSFAGNVDFDPGPQSDYTNSAASNSQIFVHKMDTNGNFIWAKSFLGSGFSGGVAYDVVIDSVGDVITTGRFTGTVDFDPNLGVYNLSSPGYSSFTHKMNLSGNTLWVKTSGPGAFGRRIAVDYVGNVYTSGYFSNTVDFNPDAGVFNQSTLGGAAIFMQQLNPFGEFNWAISYGGGGSQNDDVNSIYVDGEGSIFTTGKFNWSGDFDPGSGTFTLSSVGHADVFVQKLSQPSLFVKELIKSPQMMVYPNPSNGAIHLTFSEPINNVEITICDLLGNFVDKMEFDQLFEIQTLIDASPGVYLLTVKSHLFERTVTVQIQ